MATSGSTAQSNFLRNHDKCRGRRRPPAIHMHRRNVWSFPIARRQCKFLSSARTPPLTFGGVAMQHKNKIIAGIVLGALLSGAAQAQLQTGPMSFFVTSASSGDGGNLGGLEGADAICQARAEAVGAGNRTWRAYLSTQGPNAVNARDRIGTGPWFNAHGTQIAANVETLHSINNRMSLLN